MFNNTLGILWALLACMQWVFHFTIEDPTVDYWLRGLACFILGQIFHLQAEVEK